MTTTLNFVRLNKQSGTEYLIIRCSSRSRLRFRKTKSDDYVIITPDNHRKYGFRYFQYINTYVLSFLGDDFDNLEYINALPKNIKHTTDISNISSVLKKLDLTFGEPSDIAPSPYSREIAEALLLKIQEIDNLRLLCISKLTDNLGLDQ